MQDAGLIELQADIKIAKRNINNLRYVDDTTLMAESKEELKSLLMRVKQESEKASLQLKKKNQPNKQTKKTTTNNNQKTKDHGIQPYHCMENREGKRWK